MAKIVRLLSKRGQVACAGKSLNEVLDPIFYRHADMTPLDVEKLDIIRESVSEYRQESVLGERLNSSMLAQKACQKIIGDAQQEILLAVFVNAKLTVLGIKKIFKGTVNKSIAHPREIFREALNYPTSGIIIAHNHPSGDVTPSLADYNFTKRLIKSGETLGIEILDHIIVSDKNTISLHEETDFF